MFEAYRVLKPFEWRGWSYAPGSGNACECDCGEKGFLRCIGIVGSTCNCKQTVCRCSCGIREDRYAGDIWLVEEAHPRKEIMLAHRYAGGDGSIPPIDDLMGQRKYARLTEPWTRKAAKELVAA